MLRRSRASQLLRRHFVQRFVDNDLLSPHRDRHEALAFLLAATFAFGLVASFLLAGRFFFSSRVSPGELAVAVLDDRFLFIASSMLVMGLFMAAQWHTLSLDARDRLILGPLPVRRGQIVRAKLVAVLGFAVCVLVLLNLAPSVIYQLLAISDPSIGFARMSRLMMVHAFVTTTAGASVFAAVIAFRETLHAVAGPARFERLSGPIRFVLAFGCLTGLLLLPVVSSNLAGTWLQGNGAVHRSMAPLWFLGVYEVLAGDVVDGVPRMIADRDRRARDERFTERYRSFAPLFGTLSARAMTAVVLATLVGGLAWLWNNQIRPAPADVAPGRRPSRTSAPFTWIVRHGIVTTSLQRAAFGFASRVFLSSVPHQTAIVACLAICVAVALMTLRTAWAEPSRHVDDIPLSLLALQTFITGGLMAGCRHAGRIPAELRANWLFQVAFVGDPSAYIEGVKRAVLVMFALPGLLMLLPLHAIMTGPIVAGTHLVLGALAARLLVDVMFVRCETLPFAASYEGGADLRTLAPLTAVALVAFSAALAIAERNALRDPVASAGLLAAMGAAIAAVRVLDRRRPAAFGRFQFDEEPRTIQQLELRS